MELYQNNLSIKHWAEDDKPREKLMLKGRTSLSDAELIAILISTGTKEETAVDLSKRILNSVQNDLNALGGLSIKDLTKFKGIGEAKAISIAAALELGRRRKESERKEKPLVRSSKDAFEYIYPFLADLSHEEFWVLNLNRANRIVSHIHISKGGVAGTVVDAKVVYKHAIEQLASGLILCHNHPSGNLKPSEADIQLTQKLKEAGKFLEINVLDHLIIGEQKYFSFADEGLL